MATKTLEELLAEMNGNGAAVAAKTATPTTANTNLSSALTSVTPTSATPTSATSANMQDVLAEYDLSMLNLPGISDATKRALSDLLGGGYSPSESVDAALRELNDAMESRPGEFTSQYSQQLADIMDQIVNRDAFSYDASNDASFQQYKDIYTQQGQKGMMDTLGQASALTGGYGSSYANTAAQQTFQDYMTQLTGQIPTLRSQALSEYEAQGNALNTAYRLANDAYSRDYSQSQDDYNKWLASAQMAQDTYNTERSFDATNYQNQLDYWYNLANQENAQYESNKQYAYQTAMNMLQLGKMPSAEMLAAAGLSASDAKKMYNSYKKSSGGSSSSSSGRSSGSSGSSSTSGRSIDDMYKAIQAAVVGSAAKNVGNAVASTIKKKPAYNSGR